MSLDIIAKPQVKPIKIDEKIITEEQFENLTEPDQQDFHYFFHNDYNQDIENYHKLEEYFGNSSAMEDSLQISYSNFDFFREIILRNTHIEMFFDDGKTVPDYIPISHHWEYKFDLKKDNYFYNWDENKYKDNQNHAIEFLCQKSDCDGKYPYEELKLLVQLLNDFPLTSASKEWLLSNNLYDHYQKFIEFLIKAERQRCNLIFA